ncbi:helix-turn-helix transcriptional regulator [Shewanella marisflavi]|uniref:helix-turn-helix transcriptional regulator n=1 Tax=Shewanella marisflavi TaxID=260364 RepID=UPI003AADFAF7
MQNKSMRTAPRLDKESDHLAMYIEDTRLVYKQHIQHVFGISRSTLYRWVKSGKFPEPIMTQNGRSCWLFKDIHEWFNERLERRLGV